MQLDAAGREYVYWPVLNPDAATLEVSVNLTTWHATTPTPTGPAGEAPPSGFDGWTKVLAAGPGATSNPAGTLLLALGRNIAKIRAADNPEILFRSAGAIDVN